jgi:hypothetical protein
MGQNKERTPDSLEKKMLKLHNLRGYYKKHYLQNKKHYLQTFLEDLRSVVQQRIHKISMERK